MTACAATAANYFEIPEHTQNFLYNFASKYWNVIDHDHSGGLSYDEFRYTFGAFAYTNAGVIMTAYDSDKSGMLETTEIDQWQDYTESLLQSWGWQTNKLCIKQAWFNANRKFIF